MTPKTPTIAAALATALTLFGCGGSSSTTRSQTSALVGAAGATLKTGQTTVSIPAGAISTDTQVTLRETEPQHAGRVVRIEMEPHGLAMAKGAQVSVKLDDKNIKVKMHDDSGQTEHLAEVEVEDRNHHQFKTTVSQLGEIEVEEEHGASCTTACAANEECDDGQCKAHNEDAAAQSCDPVCDSGFECDDGACKTHNEFETQHGGTAGTCTPACASGLECDATDGVCKPHGGTP